MGFTIAGLFLVLGVLLFWLFRKVHVSNKTLRNLEGIASILSMVAAVVAIIISLQSHEKEQLEPEPLPNSPDSVVAGDTLGASAESNDDAELGRYLNEEHIRGQIGRHLAADDPQKAITFLHLLKDPDTRDEECEHIFRYSLKNGKLEDARTAAALFASPGKRDAALHDLSIEALKK